MQWINPGYTKCKCKVTNQTQLNKSMHAKTKVCLFVCHYITLWIIFVLFYLYIYKYISQCIYNKYVFIYCFPIVLYVKYLLLSLCYSFPSFFLEILQCPPPACRDGSKLESMFALPQIRDEEKAKGGLQHYSTSSWVILAKTKNRFPSFYVTHIWFVWNKDPFM